MDRKKNISEILVNKKFWWAYCVIVALINILGLVYLGGSTYKGAPPLVDFRSTTGETIISTQDIRDGKDIFHLRGLMGYGSFWGDGAERGPDFTADALHRTVVAMQAYYEKGITDRELTQYDKDAISVKVIRELHTNALNPDSQSIALNSAQIFAFNELKTHYYRMFNDASYPEAYAPAGYISDSTEIKNLASFFFWGSWVCAANRPGEDYSYTHNWPFDKAAGNTATQATFIWSVVSILGLFLGIWAVLYVYGQFKESGDPFNKVGGLITTTDLEKDYVRPTQRATYKFFAFAVVLFGLQVVAGILASMDFVRPAGISLNTIIPFNVLRSYHTLFQIYWFFMCWIGYSIFFLPRLARVPRAQNFLINTLFTLCILTGLGALVGIYMGQTGILTGTLAYWFGSQGWEFMELGRFFQFTLLASFALWIFIIYRGVSPYLKKETIWSIPSWLLWGSGIMVLFLFFGLLVKPEQNFAVSDYWRWMVVHMWVEVTFEVFTTVIVAYILVEMGLLTRAIAERVIFLAVMLFLITATIGISHNFYWIAKPTGVIALGSVFSTLQVLPLLLLTLDAWRMRQKITLAKKNQEEGKQIFVMDGVWLFILAVNFWNIFGAGVFGSLINLPIVNYYEHSTYLTGNHAHAAMFGVKGNIALAGLLFCAQHLFQKRAWNPKLVKTIFWSLNGGVALMMFLDLFPVGVYQLSVVVREGLWFARTQDVIRGPVFETLTYFRSIGGALFAVGGVIPLIWFILSRYKRLKNESFPKEADENLVEDYTQS